MEGPGTHLIYEFDGFRLDPARRLLTSEDGQPISLTSRVFDTLLYFVEHHGQLMDKDTLMQALWPDTVVEESNLTQTVSTLRRALGEQRGENRFIVTDPGRGYRFVAEVKTPTPEPVPVAATAPPSPPPGIHPGIGLIAGVLVVVFFLVGGYVYFNNGGNPTTPIAQKQTTTVVPPRSQAQQAVTVTPPQPPTKKLLRSRLHHSIPLPSCPLSI